MERKKGTIFHYFRKENLKFRNRYRKKEAVSMEQSSSYNRNELQKN